MSLKRYNNYLEVWLNIASFRHDWNLSSQCYLIILYAPDKVALVDLDEARRALELQIEALLFFVDVEVVQVVAGGCEVNLVAGEQVGEEALLVGGRDYLVGEFSKAELGLDLPEEGLLLVDEHVGSEALLGRPRWLISSREHPL